METINNLMIAFAVTALAGGITLYLADYKIIGIWSGFLGILICLLIITIQWQNNIVRGWSS